MKYYDYREKRQFLSMAVSAMLMGGAASGRSARDVVNRAHELWDEICSQTPEPAEDPGGDSPK